MIKGRELTVGSSLLVAGQIVQAIVGFGVNLVLVRYLTPEEFGRFAIILAGAALVYAVLSLRIETMVIRAQEEQLTEDIKDRYFAATIIETLIATLVIGTWMFVSGSHGIWQIGLVLALGLRHWAQQNKAFFERSMPYRKLAFVETLSTTTSHFVALVLVLSGVGWATLFIREIFLSLAGLTGLWMIGGLTIRKFYFPSISTLQHLLSEARGIWVDAALENGFARLTMLIVGFLGGDQAAGFFFQALRLAHLPQHALSPLVGRVAGNWFSRTKDRTARRQGRDRFLLILLVPLLMGAGLTIAFADPVIPWLFGETWARTADLMVGLSGFVLFLSLFEVLKSYCRMTRQIRWLLIGRIFQYLGCAIPVYATVSGLLAGDMALAIGQSVAYGLAFVVVLVILKKKEDY